MGIRKDYSHNDLYASYEGKLLQVKQVPRNYILPKQSGKTHESSKIEFVALKKYSRTYANHAEIYCSIVY